MRYFVLSILIVPEKFPVNPSAPQLPPKKEHNTRPNNKIRNRNNKKCC
jgi:hypothetical protein